MIGEANAREIVFRDLGVEEQRDFGRQGTLSEPNGRTAIQSSVRASWAIVLFPDELVVIPARIQDSTGNVVNRASFSIYRHAGSRNEGKVKAPEDQYERCLAIVLIHVHPCARCDSVVLILDAPSFSSFVLKRQ